MTDLHTRTCFVVAAQGGFVGEGGFLGTEYSYRRPRVKITSKFEHARLFLSRGIADRWAKATNGEVQHVYVGLLAEMPVP